MQRFPIARSLGVALMALTVALAVVAALGVSSLYRAREHYESTLSASGALAVAGADLRAAGVAEEEVRRGSSSSGERELAAMSYRSAARLATALAADDPASARFVRAGVLAETQARRLTRAGRLNRRSVGPAALARFDTARRLTESLQRRQQIRQADARSNAHRDSRHALLLVIIAGALALLGALVLIVLLVRSMRGPLDELVRATESLARGELDQRVAPRGPRELRALGASFNAMAAELSLARERVETERRRLAATIESLGDGVIVTWPGSTMIATVNPRAAELIPEIGPGVEADSERSPLPALADALDGETLIEHGGRTLSVTAAPLGPAGEATVWTIRDMSERIRLERAKSDFVATASHELRSPLTSIKGFIELLARFPGDMSERQREFVDIIQRSTDRLVELVGDLLDVARIEADRVEITPRPIDAGEAVREVAELMGPRIAEKGQHLGVYVAPALPLAQADPVRVRQIIANLVTNAHLYTPEGGRIHIGVEPDRAWIQIVVADNGVGMSEEEKTRIFERFYRIRDGRRVSGGTGLGLAIVKSLVELHRGQIEVDSEVGRGTTFRVLLPASSVGAAAGQSLDVIRGRRILIVDDEPQIAKLIADQLAPLDVQTTIASDGEEAISLLRSGGYDAMTLDILMPGIDGFEVLQRIRADRELRRTPIVFVSVFSGREGLAGEWVVPKPIDADELRKVLASAVRAGRSRVLVVGREELQQVLEPALDDLGIEHEWELSGLAAARLCTERRFEVALVDVGVRNPQAVLQALDLRGRRQRRTVILFGEGDAPMPAGLGKLGMEVVPVQQAAAALLAALREDG